MNLPVSNASALVAPLRAENRLVIDEGFLAPYRREAPPFGPLGAVVHARTYAAEIEDPLSSDGFRLEAWWETTRRVVEGFFGYLRQQVRSTGQHWDDAEGQHKMQRAYDLHFRGIWTAPGRGLEHMGRSTVEIKGAGVLQNCGMCSTRFLADDFAAPFCTVFDYSMLGIGMGFDTAGAGAVVLSEPKVSEAGHVVEDTREGWVAALGALLGAFVGKNPLPVGWDTSRVRPEGARLRIMGKRAAGPGALVDLLVDAEAVLRAHVGKPFSSTGIVDLMNLVGRCATSGQRRSAEIALGAPGDREFASLKDGTELNLLYVRLRALEAASAMAQKLSREIVRATEARLGLSVLDPAYLAVQRQVLALEAEREHLLAEDPEWAEIRAAIDRHPLRAYRWASNNSVMIDDLRELDADAVVEQIARNGEPGIFFRGHARRRGRWADPPDEEDSLVAGVNPCGEQALEHMEVCTLVETYPARARNIGEWLAALKYAHLYAQTVTTIPTHNQATNAVVARNRRIGTSVTGVWGLYERLGARELSRWLDAGYAEVRALNKSYAGWMGIPRSVRVTTVKPSGTVSLLWPDTEGGMKVPTAPFYMRTIRLQASSPLAATLAAAGYRVEPALREPATMVAYFPCASSARRFGADVSVWEQAEVQALLQRHWSDNAVSATLTFRPQEVRDLPRLIDLYAPRVKGLAFLPLSDHGYPQAPYIPCTGAEYDVAVARLRPLSLSGAQHEAGEQFCDGEVCVAKAS